MIRDVMKSRQTDKLRGKVRGTLRRWTTRAATALWAVLLALSAPALVLAQEEEVKHDARLDGYTGHTVTVANDSTALLWLLFVFLAVVALSGLFKDAKRTHLD